MAFDISFTGASVVVSQGKTLDTTITEFSDEDTPLECSEIEVTGNAITLNGQLVLWRKPSAYMVSVTVIPRSENDLTLSKMLYQSRVCPARAVAVSDLWSKMTIKCPRINESGNTRAVDTYKFSNGRILSGPTGPASNSEGKMSARKYTFVFQDLDVTAVTTPIEINR
jgi:hypothetical protein